MTAICFDLRPYLSGPTILLRPLTQEDFEPLASAAADPLIWEQHPDSMRYKRESRFYDWKAEQREVAIGYTFIIRRLWGGSANPEMKQMMLDHAFKSVSRVLFHIGEDNWRSRRAVEKIGGRLAGEECREEKGVMKRTVVYQIEAHRRPVETESTA